MMLAIAVELDYEVFVLDVQTAFLNADVEEDIFVKMPPGKENTDRSGVPLVMKHKTSLCGLRQSPKNWFSTMDHHLAKIGFRPLKSDSCIFVFEDDTGFVLLTLYVDDVLLLGANKQLLNKLKKQLMDRFENMMDMGDVSKVLGVNVTLGRKEGTMTINEKDYTEDIVERFSTKGCSPAFTPGAGPERSFNQAEKNRLDGERKQRYQSIVGAAMYFIQVSWYDIL